MPQIMNFNHGLGLDSEPSIPGLHRMHYVESLSESLKADAQR